MGTFFIRRLMSTAPVLLIVAVLVFAALRLTPGDPAAAIVGDSGTSEDVMKVRTELGLDKNLLSQFVIWSGRLVQGDFGHSFYFKASVTSLISQRLEPTLSMACLTILLTIIIAVPLGIIAAWRHGGLLDRFLMSFSVLGFSVPVFVVGYILIWIFSTKLNLVPSQGYARLSGGIGPWLIHLVLPVLTASVVYVALIARVTRAAVAEALTEDYVQTARAKGIGEARVLFRHALPNAAIPIVTVLGLGVAFLMGGVVVTETVFALPGLGQLTVDAVLSRDYPLIQGLTLCFSLVYVLINFIVDVSYVFLDPRIRY